MSTAVVVDCSRDFETIISPDRVTAYLRLFPGIMCNLAHVDRFAAAKLVPQATDILVPGSFIGSLIDEYFCTMFAGECRVLRKTANEFVSPFFPSDPIRFHIKEVKPRGSLEFMTLEVYKAEVLAQIWTVVLINPGTIQENDD